MATYKVPQDVEADDKLLGPFTFRQFVYLMIIFGLVMLAVGLFQIHPLLAIIPVPFILFLGLLALPIKKDQPMETYLAAIISFYTKPNKRYWLPGQSESTIEISAPKAVDDMRTRNITEDEAGRRLSFLAELVDSEGHAIKNASTIMRDDFYAEAAGTTDMFDRDNYQIANMMSAEQAERRAAVVDSMRDAIEESEYNRQGQVNFSGERVLRPSSGFVGSNTDFTASSLSGYESPSVIQPIFTPNTPLAKTPGPSANETITEEADRIRRENDSEVIIPLH